jgi:hypothetical protein
MGDIILGMSTDQSNEQQSIAKMLAAKRIVIFGLSDNPSRPSYQIAEYLQSAGKQIVPVNPKGVPVLGEKGYARIADVPGPIEIVNVFRRSEFCAEVTRDAIAAGAEGVWLQSGIMNAEAMKLAADAGILFVQNRCIMVEHARRSS